MLVIAVIPCFKSPSQAPLIAAECLKFVDKVICVDDSCPLNTGKEIERNPN